MEPTITYKSVRNGYARINTKGNLEITIPRFLKHDEKFKENLLQRGRKLQENYLKKEKIQTVNEGLTTLFGEPIAISELTPNPKKLPQELKNILEEYARPLMDHHSSLLGKQYKQLSIRKSTAKRWSCTHDQKISLNLSLVHLPTKYIIYVIIHEVCHLKVKNHSARFWLEVEKLCPQYKQIRKEMKNFVLQ